MTKPEILTDSYGTKWELISLNESKCQLRNKKYQDNVNVYDRQFIENAITSGLLERVPEKKE